MATIKLIFNSPEKSKKEYTNIFPIFSRRTTEIFMALRAPCGHFISTCPFISFYFRLRFSLIHAISQKSCDIGGGKKHNKLEVRVVCLSFRQWSVVTSHFENVLVCFVFSLSKNYFRGNIRNKTKKRYVVVIWGFHSYLSFTKALETCSRKYCALQSGK